MESEKQWKLKTRITKGVSGSPNPDLNTTQLLWPLQVYEFPLTHVKDLRGGLGTTCTDCLSSIELYRSKNKLKTSLHLVFWKNSRSPCQASDAIQGLQQQQSLCSRHWGQNQLKVEDMGQSTRLNCGCSTSKFMGKVASGWAGFGSFPRSGCLEDELDTSQGPHHHRLAEGVWCLDDSVQVTSEDICYVTRNSLVENWKFYPFDNNGECVISGFNLNLTE